MRTRKKKNVEPNRDCNTLVRPSSFRRAVAWITLVAYVGQPLIVTAQVTADQAAAANKRPVVDVTANGIPLIQIATPNAAGLSHNQYTQFNVDPAGVILNNSQTTVLTQQAGYVAGNQNLANGAASVILNEVTSTSRSQLNGYIEVAGQQAQVIVANPNGITCNGCGFINTSRGVLTTGTPVLGASGSLDALRVTGGDIQIGAAGLNASNISQLDLISRSVQVNGQLWADNLNVITGANLVNYNTLGVQIIAGNANKPTVGIDVALLGGMYANKIHLVGTEAGVGVNSLGTLAAQAGDFTLDNQGQITLAGSTTASGNISINSNTGINNSGTLYSQLDSQLASAGNITNTGLLSAKGNLTLNAASLTSTGNLGAGIDSIGNATQNGNLSITTQNQTIATGNNIAGGSISIAATDVNLANSTTVALSDISVTANGNLDNAGGSIGSARDLHITANTIIGNGNIVAGRDGNISLQGNYINATGNVIKANRNLTFSNTGTFTNKAKLEAFGNLTLTANNLDNQALATINSANTVLNINAGNITNAGQIEGNTITSTSNSFYNTGAVIGDNITLTTNSLTNLNATAIIAATQSINLIVQNALINQDGATIYSLGDINIGANLAQDVNGFLIGNTANVTNSSATIQADGNLRIGATSLINQRSTVGLMWGPEALGAPVNSGGLHYTPSYSDQQFTAATTPAGQLMAGKNMWLGSAKITNNYSIITAAQTLSASTPIVNSGSPFLQRTTVTNGTQDNWVYVQTGSHWTISCNFWGCWPSQVADYGWVNYPIAYAPLPTYAPIAGSINVNSASNTPITGSPAAQSPSTIGKAPVPSSTLTVPSSGLYTIHTQPGQPYLVVTDPRFTNYANFVSSDYMLSRLSLDPQQMQMRLGDGFYEQQLVTQQITADTGRVYLGGYTDAQSQFIALMNSGVDAAKDFNLTVGVALTTAQINSLKHDIVWMVDRNVTLPNGKTVSVLAPQVYLSSLQEADLKPSGALISANVININGSVNNSGTIRANTSLSINGSDIANQGGTISSGGETTLVASNDILNQSGNISGANVSLTAGRDITNTRASQIVTRTIGNTVVSATELNSAASITATGSLNMNAGRDVSIVAATVNAGGDATISAGRNLTADVLTTNYSATAAKYAIYDTKVTQLTSSIQTGGNLALVSGNDMHLTSAALNVGKDATLVAGGDLTLDASKNSTSSGFNSGVGQARTFDETVIGTTLNAGSKVTLTATQLQANTNAGSTATARTDGKGNITLTSANIVSQTGVLTVAADASVNIGVTQENHDSFSETHTQSSKLFTTTNLTVNSESWRSDAIGSNLSGDSVNITSGKDINVVGTNINAVHDINVAAMNDVNISAATSTYGSSYYSHETTTGMQFSSSGNPFSLTDNGPDITMQAHTDGTKQSYNRSSLSSNNGNINVVSGGNLVALGTDFAANAGNLALTAGGAVALLAGQDTLNQSSSTLIVTNPNAFTKQRHTITDTYASLDYQGSSAQANSVKISSGADTVLQAAQVIAGAGGINIDAAGDLKLLAATNSSSSTHTETLSTDGMTIKADGTPNDTATRRINNKAESQNQTNQVTSLTSAGDISTHSGGDTLIQASTLNAQGGIDLSATGYATTYNSDGTVKTQGRDGVITFAAVKDTTYNSVTKSSNSMPWQSSSGGGDYVETLKLASISAGKGLNVNATGGVAIDIPTVQATPAPVAQIDAKGNVIPPVPLTAEQQAAQRQADFNKAIQNLASKPGQAWIGQLANDPKVKVQWNQVQAAVQHWNYAHDGLTQEAVIVIAIVVAYFTAGAGSSMVGTTTAVEGGAAGATATTVGGTALATTTAAGTVSYTVAGAVINAGFSALASEVAVSFANNKGDIGKTLNDLGSSQNVKSLVAAMLTAGVMQGMSNTALMQDLQSGANAPLSASSLVSKLELNLTNATVNTAINSAVYGTSFTDALGNNLKNAGVDTLAAATANVIGQSYKADGGLLNGQPILHDLAHAALGCASASAKGQDCGSGALGGVVGEVSAELMIGSPDGSQLTPEQRGKVIFLTQLATAGAAIATGSNVNTALATSQNAVVNNAMLALRHIEDPKLAKVCAGESQGVCGLANRVNQANVTMSIQDMPQKDKWQVVAYADSNGNTVAYAAYNTETKNIDLLMDPQDLNTFMSTGPKALQAVVDIYNQAPSYGVVSGDGQIAKGWELALQDPHWWVSAVTSVVGTVAMLPSGGAGVVTSLESGAEATAATVAAPLRTANGVTLNPKLPDPVAGLDYKPNVLDSTNPNIANSQINGYVGELKLANTVADMPNQQVISYGDAVGTHGADVVSVDVTTGNVSLWDNKFRGSAQGIPSSPTFMPQSGALNGAVSDAQTAIENSNLPASVKQQAIQNLQQGNFSANTVGSGAAKNSTTVKFCNGNPC